MKIKLLIELFILQILSFSIWTIIDSTMDYYNMTDKKRIQISSILVTIITIIVYKLFD